MFGGIFHMSPVVVAKAGRRWTGYRFAMADGGHSDAVASAAWFAPALALISSVMTAIILFAAQRLVGKAAWETAMATANRDLIDQLQEERRDMLAERAAERIEWVAKFAQQRGEIINLTQALESMKSYLRRQGIEIPEGTFHPAGEMTVIEGGSGS